MPVSHKHPDYTMMATRIETSRDCVAGSDAIKSRKSSSTGTSGGIFNIEGAKYLPPPNPTDNSTENKIRYDGYKTRALFVNFTSHTKDGFLGMVNRKPTRLEFTPELEYLSTNSDGSGLPANQLVAKTLGELLDAGSYGLLADFPITEPGLSVEQTRDLKSVVKTYPRECIINWREKAINGVNVLTMVVLQENKEIIDPDGFGCEIEIWYRVLLLEEGVYVQHIYDAEENFVEEIIPRKSNGTTWTEIPFKFVGAVTNEPTPQKPLLYDIAVINVSHYRNSADYEESCFMVGQPTPVVTGLDQAWVTDILKGQISIGSRAAMLLPSGADAHLMQAEPNQMPSKAMEMKELQLSKTGAKIIADSNGRETAEAAKIRFAGQNSKLGVAVGNIENGFAAVFGWIMEFMGVSGENLLEINREFYEPTVDPQVLVAEMQLLDRGVIAKKDLRDNLRRANLITTNRTDEEIDGEAEIVSPI